MFVPRGEEKKQWDINILGSEGDGHDGFVICNGGDWFIADFPTICHYIEPVAFFFLKQHITCC